MIGINPDRAIERSDHAVCIQLEDENKWRPVHVYENPSRAPNRWHYGGQIECREPTEYTHHIGFGEMLQGINIMSNKYTDNFYKKIFFRKQSSFKRTHRT